MSIRTRLTLWYTGILAAILLLFSLALYSLLSQVLYEQVDDTIRSRAGEISSYIQAQTDPLRLLITRQVQIPPVDVFSTSNTFVQIMDRQGNIVARSANLGDNFLPIRRESFDQNLAGSAVLYTLTTAQARLRIYSAPLLILDPLEGETIIGVVQVAMSLHDVEATLLTARYAIGLGVAFTLLLAAGVGAFMSHAALRPIDQITQTALQISRAEDLSRRLPTLRTQDELARLTDTFNEMLGRLEELFQQQQRLVADVSHELRTPLTTLRGNLDLLRRGMEQLPPEDIQDILQTMEGEITRMSRLVADLLLLSQADAGVQIKKEVVELDAVLLDVYRQALLMADGVRVELGHEDRALVLGDRDRLHQLLLNLVDNAIKYTPAGGTVRLSLYRREDWVQVSVADTGVGIAKEDLPHIFERFYRSDRARSRQTGGTGLGLSIAKWIAEAHGGHLTVESELGVGSTFTLWLRPYAPRAGTAENRAA